MENSWDRIECSKQLHGLYSRSVLEIHCRHHSHKTDSNRIKVYHRWVFRKGKWTPIPDRKQIIPLKRKD